MMMKGSVVVRSALKPIRTTSARVEEGEDVAVIGVGGQEDGQPLSPMARLFHEPQCNLYIVAMLGSNTPIDPVATKANLHQTLLRHPRFSSLQVMDDQHKGGMKWVRTKVDLEKHVIVPDVSITADKETDSSDKVVEDYISDLSTTTIHSSQPLWDLHILNIPTSASASTAIFRVHHSVGDGVSLMSFLLACTRNLSDPYDLPTLHAVKAGPIRMPLGFWSRLRLLRNTVVDVAMFAATVCFLKDTKTPLLSPSKSYAGSGSYRRRFVLRTVNLEDLKMVKNALGATMNDVIIGVTQAGLSRYLNKRYGEARKNRGEAVKGNNLPKKLRVRAPLFINLRSTIDVPAAADLMTKGLGVKWGNQIGYVLLPFEICMREDPLDYVRLAKKTTNRKKHSLEAFCTFPIAATIMKLFGIKAGSVLTTRVPSNTTICFSNMVGPKEEIGFYGNPITYIAPSCYGHPSALMVHFQSYANKMTFVLSVDEIVVPYPHHLCDDFEEALRLMKEAVLAKTSVS